MTGKDFADYQGLVDAGDGERHRAAGPITLVDPICDGGGYEPLWLVPGDWSRGQAVAHVAMVEGDDFIRFRARRCWLRWSHHDFVSAGWRLEDGTLVGCGRTDPGAEPYWEVTPRSMASTARPSTTETPGGASRPHQPKQEQEL